MEQIHRCEKCGIDLFEQLQSSKKVFAVRSFATKVRDGHEVYYCLNCYKEVNNGIRQTEGTGSEERW